MSEGGSISRLTPVKIDGVEGRIMIVTSHDTVEFQITPSISFKRSELLAAMGLLDNNE